MVQTFIQVPISTVIVPINSYWVCLGLECDIKLFEIDTVILYDIIYKIQRIN